MANAQGMLPPTQPANLPYVTACMQRLSGFVWHVRWLAAVTAFLILIADVKPALAGTSCDQSVFLLERFRAALLTGDEKTMGQIGEAAAAQRASLIPECLCLGEMLLLPIARPEDPRKWHLFCEPLEQGRAGWNQLYEACKQSECRYQPEVQKQVLMPACRYLSRRNAECQEGAGKKLLSKQRLALGLSLVLIGSSLSILGAVEMGVPVFKTQGGCGPIGFDMPCTASPYAVGAPMFTFGILGALGGALTLGLPRR